MQEIAFNYHSVKNWFEVKPWRDTLGSKQYEIIHITHKTAEAIFDHCKLTKKDLKTLESSLIDQYAQLANTAHLSQDDNQTYLLKTFKVNLVKGVWQTLRILYSDSIKLNNVSHYLAENDLNRALRHAGYVFFELNRKSAFIEIAQAYLKTYKTELGLKKIQNLHDSDNKQLLLQTFHYIMSNQSFTSNLPDYAHMEDSDKSN